jgi:hypothetical protein
MSGLFRVYGTGDAFDSAGYPEAWQQIKHIVRSAAGDRCERCHHPYKVGQHPLERTETAGGIQMVSWSPCDPECRHGGPMRVWTTEEWQPFAPTPEACGAAVHAIGKAEAAWRVLTVHHLTGEKADCRWWNLAALCQRDHLTIQGKVVMDREFIREHTPWMKPHAAGFYAWKYLGEDLTRDETMARLDELLALELREESLF